MVSLIGCQLFLEVQNITIRNKLDVFILLGRGIIGIKEEFIGILYDLASIVIIDIEVIIPELLLGGLLILLVM